MVASSNLGEKLKNNCLIVSLVDYMFTPDRGFSVVENHDQAVKSVRNPLADLLNLMNGKMATRKK